MLRKVFEVVGGSMGPGAKRAREGGRAARWGLGLILTASCSSGVSLPAASNGDFQLYIGAIDGTDAKIAFVRDASQWAAYACGGPTTLTSITTWFHGEAPPDANGDISSVSDDKELDATFSDGDVRGEMTFQDGSAPFIASSVALTSKSGLFQDDSNGCRSGLIVPPSGSGDPQGVYCVDIAAEGKITGRLFEQVTPVAPVGVRNGFITARVVDSQKLVLHLTPVLLPLGSN